MRRILVVLVLWACSLGTVSFAAPPEKYTALVMPDNVTLGMTREAVQSARPDARKLDGAVGSRNTNATVLIEIKNSGVPFLFDYYHFIENRLRAVTQGIGHYGKRDEQTIKHIRDALTRDLAKQADETILRLDKNMQQVLVTAELWKDEKNGTCVYFVDASNEMTVITFDPKYFEKKDFFMSPDEMPKIALALETVRKTIEASKKQKSDYNPATP